MIPSGPSNLAPGDGGGWGAALDLLAGAFLTEAYRHQAALELHLAALETEDTADARHGFHRAAHTVAGTCVFFGHIRLSALTRAGEILLVGWPAEEPLSPAALAALRDLVQAVREIVSRIAAGGTEGEEAYSSVIERLGSLTPGTATVR
jgi:chemotaxis protein histidine kinase CheA